MSRLQSIWQLASLLMLALASFVFITFKPALVFNLSDFILGILTSIATWVIIHLAYEIVSETPFKYYRTGIGFADSVVSGIILSVIYVYSGFNLLVHWIAYALHNLLIWISVASLSKDASIFQLKGKAASIPLMISSSCFSPYMLNRIKYMPKTIFKVLLVSLLAMPIFVSLAFATHNPSVSHSANSVTNGAFHGNYSKLEVRL